MKKNNKIKIGILFGITAGIIDIIPMIIQKLTWDANLSAFFYWIMVGFFIATVDIKIKGILKGILISTITLIPLTFLIWWNDTSSILPMSISTIVLGSLLGYFINRFEQK